MSLQAMLGDIPKSRFVADYYHRLPFSAHGTASELRELGSWEVFGRLVGMPDSDVMVVRRGQRADSATPRSADELRRLIDDGCTVLLRHAERHEPRLAQLARSFERELGGEVNIHMYATPADQFGFGWHYDAEEVFIVQTAGVKEYSLRKNTVNPWPLVETLPDDMLYEREIMPLVRCSLSAGDWLYIPSGYWHMAAASETALSLAIGVLPMTGIDVFDQLRPQLLDSILWRQRLPTAGEATSMDEVALRAEYRRLLGQLATDLQQRLESEVFLQRLIERQRVVDAE